jgi:ferredoxin-type protein NapG
MDRRDFFRSAVKKTTKKAVELADAKVTHDALRWIRPPFAITELDFLLSCTRCDDCIEACPHDVIFPLASRLGKNVAGTPALDLLNKGCHLCEDWSCVTACEKDALVLPKTSNDEDEDAKNDEPVPPPRLAFASINTETCFPYSGPECGACNNTCPIPDALQWDQQRPIINQEACVGCGLCREVCIVDPSAITITMKPHEVIDKRE